MKTVFICFDVQFGGEKKHKLYGSECRRADWLSLKYETGKLSHKQNHPGLNYLQSKQLESRQNTVTLFLILITLLTLRISFHAASCCCCHLDSVKQSGVFASCCLEF